jgi:hypothetical protein
MSPPRRQILEGVPDVIVGKVRVAPSHSSHLVT